MINQELLRKYAELCRITYLSRVDALTAYRAMGYENARMLAQSQPLEQIYLIHDGDDYLAMLTGTNQLLDWVGNILAIPGWDVHAGYAAIANSIGGQIRREFIQSGAKRLLLIGHSKGGAVAAVLASQIYDLNVQAVSFGAPRIGSAAFAKEYDNSKCFRVAHPEDIVTRLPLTGYVHCGVPIVWSHEERRMQSGKESWLKAQQDRKTWQLFLNPAKSLKAHFSYWNNQ